MCSMPLLTSSFRLGMSSSFFIVSSSSSILSAAVASLQWCALACFHPCWQWALTMVMATAALYHSGLVLSTQQLQPQQQQQQSHVQQTAQCSYCELLIQLPAQEHILLFDCFGCRVCSNFSNNRNKTNNEHPPLFREMIMNGYRLYWWKWHCIGLSNWQMLLPTPCKTWLEGPSTFSSPLPMMVEPSSGNSLRNHPQRLPWDFQSLHCLALMPQVNGMFGGGGMMCDGEW